MYARLTSRRNFAVTSALIVARSKWPLPKSLEHVSVFPTSAATSSPPCGGSGGVDLSRQLEIDQRFATISLIGPGNGDTRSHRSRLQGLYLGYEEKAGFPDAWVRDCSIGCEFRAGEREKESWRLETLVPRMITCFQRCKWTISGAICGRSWIAGNRFARNVASYLMKE